MSALPPKADIGTHSRNVRYVPKADSCIAAKSLSFDHVVGALPQEQRHVETERLGGFQIDHQLELVRSLDGELARFCALEDAVTIGCCTPELAEWINAVGHQAAGFGKESK